MDLEIDIDGILVDVEAVTDVDGMISVDGVNEIEGMTNGPGLNNEQFGAGISGGDVSRFSSKLGWCPDDCELSHVGVSPKVEVGTRASSARLTRSWNVFVGPLAFFDSRSHLEII